MKENAHEERFERSTGECELVATSETDYERYMGTIQGLLALLFLFAGGMKLLLPIEVLLAQIVAPLSGLFIRFIGVIEVAGVLGLILLAALREIFQ